MMSHSHLITICDIFCWQKTPHPFGRMDLLNKCKVHLTTWFGLSNGMIHLITAVKTVRIWVQSGGCLKLFRPEILTTTVVISLRLSVAEYHSHIDDTKHYVENDFSCWFRLQQSNFVFPVYFFFEKFNFKQRKLFSENY